MREIQVVDIRLCYFIDLSLFCNMHEIQLPLLTEGHFNLRVARTQSAGKVFNGMLNDNDA